MSVLTAVLRRRNPQLDLFNFRESTTSPGYWAIVFVLLGRALKMRSDPPRPFFRWGLLWELPSALALMFLVLAIAEHANLKPDSNITLGVALVFGYLGPDALAKILERLLLGKK